MNLAERQEAMEEFFAECDEILERASTNLVKIEAGDISYDRLDELYRDIHTFKGSAQLFGLVQIGQLAHAIEATLTPVRKFCCPPGPALLEAIFESIKTLDLLLNDVKQEIKTDPAAIRPLLAKLTDAVCQRFASELKVSRDVTAGAELLPSANAADKSKVEAYVQAAPTPAAVASPAVTPASIPVPVRISAQPKAPTPVVTLRPTETIMKHEVSDESSPKLNGETDSTIRVQVGILDNLMNLVGEMVLVRNQVLQHSSRSEDLEFLNLSQRLDVVTSELQEQVMRTRMQPIGNVLSKFQRVIRDLAKDLDKRIDLTVHGKDTELDKTLLEAIKDPLTHIVRNSCDHGVEKPEQRVAAGKPETGHVLISAYHEGGQVIVEISDDGRGMNRQKLVQKAVERGLHTLESAERLTDSEKLNLIFHPGFSTAVSVSSVSGRGVGMDVVRTNIEKIGGSVEIASVDGKGSTIRLKIPLTLAIVPAMLVRSGGADYAIPQVKLVELVRVDQETPERNKIHFVQGKPVYELRGRLLPLINMDQVLRGTLSTPEDLSSVNIVVLNADGDLYGLIVDEVLDTADIVVKPLSKFLKSLEVYSAATILGSGRVALIIDPLGLAKVGGLQLEKKQIESDYLRSTSSKEMTDSQEFLLFKTRGAGKYSIPLCMVSRLEEFSVESVEYSGSQKVMQYRGSILPLIDLNSILGFGESPAGAVALATIVVARNSRFYGLVVDEILDVTDCDTLIDDTIRDRFGLLGNIVLHSEIVNVIDALAIIDQVAAKNGDETLKAVIGNQTDSTPPAVRRVLFAEDVAFFRRQTAKILMAQGYEVYAVEDGKKALDLLTSHAPHYFDLILSDIEMPVMNGMNFARSARQTEQGASIPMIALTTRFKQSDIDEGLNAGFNAYLEKLNPEVLISHVTDLIKKQGKAA